MWEGSDLQKFVTAKLHTIKGMQKWMDMNRATEILKSKSVRLTDDVIRYASDNPKITKTNDSSFSSKSVSEIDYFSNTL